METNKLLKVFLIGLVVLAIPVAVYLTRSGKTEIRTKAGQIEAALVFLMPAETEIDFGERVDFLLKVDTGKETAGGAEITLNFDHRVLKLADEIKSGPAFSSLTVKENPGQVILYGEGKLIGQGTVATLAFERINAGEAAIEIDPDSIIWDENKSANILRRTAGAMIIAR